MIIPGKRDEVIFLLVSFVLHTVMLLFWVYPFGTTCSFYLIVDPLMKLCANYDTIKVRCTLKVSIKYFTWYKYTITFSPGRTLYCDVQRINVILSYFVIVWVLQLCRGVQTIHMVTNKQFGWVLMKKWCTYGKIYRCSFTCYYLDHFQDINQSVVLSP